MRVFSTLVIVAISISNIQSQSLNDSLFLAKFQSATYDLSSIQPEFKRVEWELIAGFCQQTDQLRSDSETEGFSSLLDSIRAMERKKINLRWNLCENECERNYLECLTDNIGKNNRSSNCDSLQTVCERQCSKTNDDEYDSLENEIDDRWSGFRYSHNYIVEHRYGKKELLRVKFSDEYFCMNRGFGTWCPPSWCTWMVLTQIKNQTKIVDSFEKLSKFLGEINNASEAYLLYKGSEIEPSSGFPIGNFTFQYHNVGSAFYILKELQLSDCPIERYRCLIEVKKGKPAKIIDKRLTYESDICI